MANKQKYFHIESCTDGRLLSQFAMVANIESTDSASIVAGNERVIRPRFADAQFFFMQDQKLGLDDYAKLLPQVIFMHGLGSLHDKQIRLARLAQRVNTTLEVFSLPHAPAADIARVAALLKADLMTQVVDEFPEMQGIAGYYYAIAKGEKEAIATAIKTHYLPRNQDDDTAADLLGQIFAISDRIDTLAGMFAIGKAPTSDKDPFALRRAAFGLFRTLDTMGLHLALDDLIDWALEPFAQSLSQGSTLSGIRDKLKSFFMDRLCHYLQDHHGLVQALSHTPTLDILDLKMRFDLLAQYLNQSEFISICENNRRLYNFLNKEPSIAATTSSELPAVEEKYLTQPEELSLWQAIQKQGPAMREQYQTRQYGAILQALLGFAPLIDNFFREVLINSPDKNLRDNRIALLRDLYALFSLVADFHHIQIQPHHLPSG